MYNTPIKTLKCPLLKRMHGKEQKMEKTARENKCKGTQAEMG